MTHLEAAVKAARDKFQGDDNDWIFLTTAERTTLILTELAANVSEEMVEVALVELKDQGPIRGRIKSAIAAALMAAGKEAK